MKIYKTISLLMIAAIAVVSFSSCTVRYHSGHRRYHRDYNYMPAINNGTQTVSVKPASLHNLPVAN